MVEILLIFKIHIFIISGASKCPFSQRYRFPNRSSPSIPSTPHSPMRVSVFRLQVPGFKVSGFGFRVRVSGLASRVKVQGLGFRVRVQNQACALAPFQGLGFRVQGLGLRVQGLELRVWGLGLRVQGSGMCACAFSVETILHPIHPIHPTGPTPKDPCTLYTLHPKPNSTPYTLHLNPTPYTLHPTPYTMNPEP